MVAFTIPTSTLDLPNEVFPLDRPSRLELRARYWRRRLAVVCALATTLAVGGLVAGRVAAVLGGAPASAPEHRPVPAEYTVQPGDTLWSIARQIKPKGDVADVVQSLVRANGGAELHVGQRLILSG